MIYIYYSKEKIDNLPTLSWLSKRIGVRSIIEWYDQEMHLYKMEEDYRRKNGASHMNINTWILRHAYSVYSIKMFHLSQTELLGCIDIGGANIGPVGARPS